MLKKWVLWDILCWGFVISKTFFSEMNIVKSWSETVSVFFFFFLFFYSVCVYNVVKSVVVLRMRALFFYYFVSYSYSVLSNWDLMIWSRFTRQIQEAFYWKTFFSGELFPVLQTKSWKTSLLVFPEIDSTPPSHSLSLEGY